MEAGVDCIEHGGLLDQPTAEHMAKNGIFLVSTLGESWLMAERGVEFGRPAWLVEESKGHLDARMGHFMHAVKAGVKIAAGTDVLGDMYTEMKLLMKGGMTAMQAIEARRGWAPKSCGEPTSSVP